MPIIHKQQKQHAISRIKREPRPVAAFGKALASGGKKGVWSNVEIPHTEGARRLGEVSGTRALQSLAPELFELDEFGNAHEIGDGSVPKGLEDKAWLAQANCPEIAIDVTEE